MRVANERQAKEVHRQGEGDRPTAQVADGDRNAHEIARSDWLNGGIRPFVAIVVIAMVGWLVWHRGTVGYDGLYSLIWGGDLASGRMPDLTSPVAPTPHPLANLFALPVSRLGGLSLPALEAAAFASYGAVVYLLARLAAAIFGFTASVLAGLLAATSPSLVEALLDSSIDVTFVALLLLAVVMLVERKPVNLVLVVLAVAGLLRPEAWLFAALLAAWSITRDPHRSWRSSTTTVGLAIAAPVIWATTDLLLTGDPLFSLHGTRELAAELSRPRSAETAFRVLPDYLFTLIGRPTVWAGMLTAFACIWLMPARAILPLVTMLVGLIAFLAIGFAGLSVIPRYLLLPAVMLIALAAGGPTLWRHMPTRSTQWGVSLVLALLSIGLISVALRANSVRADHVAAFANVRAQIYSDLRELLARRDVKHEVASCPPLLAHNHRPVPLVAYELNRRPRSIGLRRRDSARGVMLIPASTRTERHFVFTSDIALYGSAVPEGFRVLASNESWLLVSSC